MDSMRFARSALLAAVCVVSGCASGPKVEVDWIPGIFDFIFGAPSERQVERDLNNRNIHDPPD
jgi:hypothetical protein